MKNFNLFAMYYVLKQRLCLTSIPSQVKVLLRISPSFPGETSSFLKVDQKKKQVTLYCPTAINHVSQKYRRMGIAAPKMFAFDSIFEPDSSQVLLTLYSQCIGEIV